MASNPGLLLGNSHNFLGFSIDVLALVLMYLAVITFLLLKESLVLLIASPNQSPVFDLYTLSLIFFPQSFHLNFNFVVS